MEEAVCLLQIEEDDQMKLNDEGVRMIADIPEGYGVIPMTLVGPGRTGKSSLLNMLAKKNVFKTGSSFDRVTKGIWIYIKLENERNRAFVYIDVEGFGDPSQENVIGKNNRLLMVVSQICDVIIYNTKGVPDDSMLHKLGLVCHLFDKHRKQDQVLSKPILVVLLRDYDLDGMESQNSDKSFRDMLKRYTGGKCANETFRDIKYEQLVMPTERRKTRDLQNMSDESLDEEFVEKREELEIFIRMNAKPLGSESGTTVTGKVLADGVRITVKSVNKDSFEGLEQSLTDALKLNNERKMQKALKEFEELMESGWPETTAPETLADVQTNTTKRTIKEKLQGLYDAGQTEATLLAKFETQTQRIFATISEKRSKKELVKINNTLEERLRDRFFETIGGFEQYCKDKQSVENNYKRLKNLGPMKEDVWNKYQESLESKKESISITEKILCDKAEAEKKLLKAEESAKSWGKVGATMGTAMALAALNVMKK